MAMSDELKEIIEATSQPGRGRIDTTVILYNSGKRGVSKFSGVARDTEGNARLFDYDLAVDRQFMDQELLASDRWPTVRASDTTNCSGRIF